MHQLDKQKDLIISRYTVQLWKLRKESYIRNGDTVDEDGAYTELGTGHSQEGTTAERSDGSPGKEPSGELGVDHGRG